MHKDGPVSRADGNHVIRVAVADGHAMFRDGLRTLLEGEPGFRVIGEAADGAEAVKIARQMKPHVLLLDLAMPRYSGLEALRSLQALPGSTRTLLLAGRIAKQELIEALLLGAYGLVLKTATAQLLFKSIRAVMSGQYWLDRESVSDVVQALRDFSRRHEAETRPKALGLTPRESEIVAATVAGYSTPEMAQRLGLREVTIRHHFTKIFHKLGVSSRLALALFAVNHHWTSSDGLGAKPQLGRTVASSAVMDA